jgi:16S rRNA processing protein RimM
LTDGTPEESPASDKTVGRLYEGGVITNTHGLRGEVKITPYTSTPQFLAALPRLTVGETEYKSSARVHKNAVIAVLNGVDTHEKAEALRGSTVFFKKEDAPLKPGQHMVADLLGLSARDENGEAFGVISDYYSLPSNDVYVVSARSGEVQIPAVPEFVLEINEAGGFVRFRLIEGL